ncbi:putative transposase [Sulfitobacter geojensis]|nr:putative transposase [Sulfitobacter geojensis]
MKIPSDLPGPTGFRYPREVIVYAVSAYHRFPLGIANTEYLSAARGVIVSREMVRLWVDYTTKMAA